MKTAIVIPQLDVDEATCLEALLAGGKAPEEFRIFRAGDNPSTKGHFSFSKAAADAVWARYKTMNRRLAIDYNHGSLQRDSQNPSQTAKSAGSFELEIRDGEAWAVNVKWTPDGKRAVEHGEFSYMSPAFAKNSKNEPTWLINVGITADPSLHDLSELTEAASALYASMLAAEQASSPILAINNGGSDAEALDGFEESQHPRESDGKFGSGGGGDKAGGDAAPKAAGGVMGRFRAALRGAVERAKQIPAGVKKSVQDKIAFAKVAKDGISAVLHGKSMTPEQSKAVKAIAFKVATKLVVGALASALPGVGHAIGHLAAAHLPHVIEGIAHHLAEHAAKHAVEHMVEHAAKHAAGHHLNVVSLGAMLSPEELLMIAVLAGLEDAADNMSDADIDALAPDGMSDDADDEDTKAAALTSDSKLDAPPPTQDPSGALAPANTKPDDRREAARKTASSWAINNLGMYGPTGQVPDHPSATQPLSYEYPSATASGGWIGCIEPNDGTWIAFVTPEGKVALWTERNPDGSIVGSPMLFQRDMTTLEGGVKDLRPVTPVTPAKKPTGASPSEAATALDVEHSPENGQFVGDGGGGSAAPKGAGPTKVSPGAEPKSAPAAGSKPAGDTKVSPGNEGGPHKDVPDDKPASKVPDDKPVTHPSEGAAKEATAKALSVSEAALKSNTAADHTAAANEHKAASAASKEAAKNATGTAKAEHLAQAKEHVDAAKLHTDAAKEAAKAGAGTKPTGTLLQRLVAIIARIVAGVARMAVDAATGKKGTSGYGPSAREAAAAHEHAASSATRAAGVHDAAGDRDAKAAAEQSAREHKDEAAKQRAAAEDHNADQAAAHEHSVDTSGAVALDFEPSRGPDGKFGPSGGGAPTADMDPVGQGRAEGTTPGQAKTESDIAKAPTLDNRSEAEKADGAKALAETAKGVAESVSKRAETWTAKAQANPSAEAHERAANLNRIAAGTHRVAAEYAPKDAAKHETEANYHAALANYHEAVASKMGHSHAEAASIDAELAVMLDVQRRQDSGAFSYGKTLSAGGGGLVSGVSRRADLASHKANAGDDAKNIVLLHKTAAKINRDVAQEHLDIAAEHSALAAANPKHAEQHKAEARLHMQAAKRHNDRAEDHEATAIDAAGLNVALDAIDASDGQRRTDRGSYSYATVRAGDKGLVPGISKPANEASHKANNSQKVDDHKAAAAANRTVAEEHLDVAAQHHKLAVAVPVHAEVHEVEAAAHERAAKIHSTRADAHDEKAANLPDVVTAKDAEKAEVANADADAALSADDVTPAAVPVSPTPDDTIMFAEADAARVAMMAREQALATANQWATGWASDMSAPVPAVGAPGTNDWACIIAPLTWRYHDPVAVGGWLGAVEPMNRAWIAFVATNGMMLLWQKREADGGVIGTPIQLWRALNTLNVEAEPALYTVDMITRERNGGKEYLGIQLDIAHDLADHDMAVLHNIAIQKGEDAGPKNMLAANLARNASHQAREASRTVSAYPSLMGHRVASSAHQLAVAMHRDATRLSQGPVAREHMTSARSHDEAAKAHFDVAQAGATAHAAQGAT